MQGIEPLRQLNLIRSKHCQTCAILDFHMSFIFLDELMLLLFLGLVDGLISLETVFLQIKWHIFLLYYLNTILKKEKEILEILEQINTYIVQILWRMLTKARKMYRQIEIDIHMI